MKRVTLHDKDFVLYIPCEQIESAIKQVAERINQKYSKNEQPPIFVTVLSGAFMFVSELMRHIDLEVDLAFTSISSYSGTESRELKCNLDLKFDVKNRDIIILDEIVDSGKTVVYLADKYLSNGAKSVSIATMIYKSETANRDLDVEFKGIEMRENNFIVGYGLDYNEKGRNLKDIYILAEKDE